MKYENVTEIFDSVNAFYSALQNRETNSTFKDKEDSDQREDGSFSGTESFEEANKLLLNGDFDNSNKLQSVRIKNNTDNYVLKYKKQIKRDVAGFMPCVPVYLSGQPRNMFAAKNVYTKTKILNIVVSSAVPGCVSSDKITNAGAQIASLVCSLEKANIRVNLYVEVKTKKANQTLTLLVKIKNAGAPLNKLRITYPIVNPSFLRRHYFRWVETNKNNIRSEFVHSYGWVVDDNKCVIKDSKVIKIMDIIEGKESCDTITKKILG